MSNTIGTTTAVSADDLNAMLANGGGSEVEPQGTFTLALISIAFHC